MLVVSKVAVPLQYHCLPSSATVKRVRSSNRTDPPPLAIVSRKQRRWHKTQPLSPIIQPELHSSACPADRTIPPHTPSLGNTVEALFKLRKTLSTTVPDPQMQPGFHQSESAYTAGSICDKFKLTVPRNTFPVPLLPL